MQTQTNKTFVGQVTNKNIYHLFKSLSYTLKRFSSFPNERISFTSLNKCMEITLIVFYVN